MKFIIGIIFIVQGGYLVEERLIDEYCTDWWDKRLVIMERSFKLIFRIITNTFKKY